MQRPCAGSTYVSRYRRSCNWRPAHVHLPSAVRHQFGQNWRTWPGLPHLKHSFSGHIVWGWLVGVEPARVRFRQTVGPRPLPPVREPIAPQAAAGVPSPATVSPSHVSAADVTGAIGTPPPSETAASVVGGVGGALVVLPRPNRGLGGG